MNCTQRTWMISLVWSAIFIWAGVEKIMQPTAFAQAIAAYKILPNAWVPLMAGVLPWVEVWAALALLWPRFRSAGALIVAGLSLVFAVAVTSAMVRGLDITCGCFGLSSGKVGWKTLLLDVAGIISMSWLLFEASKKAGVRIFK